MTHALPQNQIRVQIPKLRKVFVNLHDFDLLIWAKFEALLLEKALKKGAAAGWKMENSQCLCYVSVVAMRIAASFMRFALS